MKNNIINEELNKIKYLFKYKKGVVISEQDIPAPPPPTTGATDMSIPPPPPTTGATDMGVPPMSGATTPQEPVKVNVDKLRDCSGYKSGGKLTKGEEKDGFIIFNNEKSIPVCKKPKE